MSIYEDSHFMFLSASSEDFRCCMECGDEYEAAELRSGYCSACVEMKEYDELSETELQEVTD